VRRRGGKESDPDAGAPDALTLDWDFSNVSIVGCH